MKTRLAMVAAKGCVEGPWMRGRGNETGIRIRNLVEGERIIVMIDVEGVIQHACAYDCDGTFDLPKGWDKIRFDKHVANGVVNPTHVDLLVA